METKLSITLHYSGEIWDVVIRSDSDNQEAKERIETIPFLEKENAMCSAIVGI